MRLFYGIYRNKASNSCFLREAFENLVLMNFQNLLLRYRRKAILRKVSMSSSICELLIFG
jgi:hypothetical protein